MMCETRPVGNQMMCETRPVGCSNSSKDQKRKRSTGCAKRSTGSSNGQVSIAIKL